MCSINRAGGTKKKRIGKFSAHENVVSENNWNQSPFKSFRGLRGNKRKILTLWTMKVFNKDVKKSEKKRKPNILRK